MSNREQGKMKKMLYDAQVLANKVAENRGATQRRHIESA